MELIIKKSPPLRQQGTDKQSNKLYLIIPHIIAFVNKRAANVTHNLMNISRAVGDARSYNQTERAKKQSSRKMRVVPEIFWEEEMQGSGRMFFFRKN